MGKEKERERGSISAPVFRVNRFTSSNSRESSPFTVCYNSPSSSSSSSCYLPPLITKENVLLSFFSFSCCCWCIMHSLHRLLQLKWLTLSCTLNWQRRVVKIISKIIIHPASSKVVAIDSLNMIACIATPFAHQNSLLTSLLSSFLTGHDSNCNNSWEQIVSHLQTFTRIFFPGETAMMRRTTMITERMAAGWHHRLLPYPHIHTHTLHAHEWHGHAFARMKDGDQTRYCNLQTPLYFASRSWVRLGPAVSLLYPCICLDTGTFDEYLREDETVNKNPSARPHKKADVRLRVLRVSQTWYLCDPLWTGYTTQGDLFFSSLVFFSSQLPREFDRATNCGACNHQLMSTVETPPGRETLFANLTLVAIWQMNPQNTHSFQAIMRFIWTRMGYLLIWLQPSASWHSLIPCHYLNHDAIWILTAFIRSPLSLHLTSSFMLIDEWYLSPWSFSISKFQIMKVFFFHSLWEQEKKKKKRRHFSYSCFISWEKRKPFITGVFCDSLASQVTHRNR